MHWNRLRQSRSFIAWSVFTIAVLVFQFGSHGDRLMVGVVWLALVVLPMERLIHRLAAFMARFVLPRYIMLSVIGLIWAWATCRLRGGDGPFHNVQLGTWRGYPLPFEEWIFISNPSPSSWREFHWLGLGDVLILAAAFFLVWRWLRRSDAPVQKTRAVLLVGFTIVFVWLNIDYWIAGSPITWIGSQPEIRFFNQARRGFPFPYDGVVPFPDWQWSALAMDVSIGLAAWAALYGARSLAQWIRG